MLPPPLAARYTEPNLQAGTQLGVLEKQLVVPLLSAAAASPAAAAFLTNASGGKLRGASIAAATPC